MIFTFLVQVETDTLEHAKQVLSERTGYDEMYDDEDGKEFDYQFGKIDFFHS